jgi:hypothetical protein
VRRQIACHYGTGTHERACANRSLGDNAATGTEKNMMSNAYTAGNGNPRSEQHIVAN